VPAAAEYTVRPANLDDGSTNRLLDALPAATRDRWFAGLTPSFIKLKTVLFDAGQVIDSVYFPLNAVIALVTPLWGGAIVEVATIGNEGIVGVPVVLGGSLAVRAISQVAGWVLPMQATAFLEAVNREASVGDIVNDYLQALFSQISQAAACNRLHSNEERLSCWLLMSHDRIGVDTFTITHEFLGQLLGSRRATVTLSAGILQASGLIKYHRGEVTIVDRPGLEAASMRVLPRDQGRTRRCARQSPPARSRLTRRTPHKERPGSTANAARLKEGTNRHSTCPSPWPCFCLENSNLRLTGDSFSRPRARAQVGGAGGGGG
jgi:CRP-like cAMP-binding protein